MGFNYKKLLKKAAPALAGIAVGAGGMAAYQKYAPLAKSYMQDRRAQQRSAEQAQLFPSVAPPMSVAPQQGQPRSYASQGGGFWAFLARLFGMG